jgi:hypothetical protein
MNAPRCAPLPAQDRWLLLQGLLQLCVGYFPRVGERAALGTVAMVNHQQSNLAEDRVLQSTGTILERVQSMKRFIYIAMVIVTA